MLVKRILLTAAVATAAVVGTSSPAMARDVCAGVYEIDGCEYCSYQGAPTASSPSNCDAGYTGYYWAGCGAWVNSVCIGGMLT